MAMVRSDDGPSVPGLGRIAPERGDADPYDVRVLPVDSELDASSPFLPIWETWNRRRRPGHPAVWEEFDFVDFKGWHSHLVISTFPPDGEPDPYFRVMGEAWRIVYDGSITGMRFSEIAPHNFSHQLRQHFAEIKRTSGIGIVSGQVRYQDRQFLHFTVLELPVSRERVRVGGLLHCLHLER